MISKQFLSFRVTDLMAIMLYLNTVSQKSLGVGSKRGSTEELGSSVLFTSLFMLMKMLDHWLS